MIDEDADLNVLGCKILTMIYASMGGSFFITSNETMYWPSWSTEGVLCSRASVKDLGKHFVFSYIESNDWIFNGVISKLDEKMNTDEIILDGAGSCIIEGRYDEFIDYLNGDIDGDDIIELDDNGLPYLIEKYGEFDLPYDVESENNYLKETQMKSHMCYEAILNRDSNEVVHYNYGLQCYQGRGCVQDIPKAIKHFEIAVEMTNYHDAIELLIEIYSSEKYKNKERLDELNDLLNQE